MWRKSLWSCILIKVWVFWEGHRIWKKSSSHFWLERCVLCRNSVLVKKYTKIFQNKYGQFVLYKLYGYNNTRREHQWWNFSSLKWSNFLPFRNFRKIKYKPPLKQLKSFWILTFVWCIKSYKNNYEILNLNGKRKDSWG